MVLPIELVHTDLRIWIGSHPPAVFVDHRALESEGVLMNHPMSDCILRVTALGQHKGLSAFGSGGRDTSPVRTGPMHVGPMLTAGIGALCLQSRSSGLEASEVLSRED